MSSDETYKTACGNCGSLMYGVIAIDDANDALQQAHAERDALVAALREIEDFCDAGIALGDRHIQSIARKALASMETGHE